MALDIDIKKDLGGFKLDISIQAEDEVLALLGASGCGKSMTLRAIAGIVTPDEGHIIVNGRTLFDSGKKINLTPQQRRVGLLFQNYALFPNMTVEQNIITGMTNLELTKVQKKQRCAEMIEKFYLNGLDDHKPAQLSGGQQQRVALARIMVSEPSILMLDEPFSALDSFLRWELEQELMSVLEDFKGTAVIVSHNRDEVYRISDHIAVIHEGHVDSYGTKNEIFTKPTTYQSALLTGIRNFSRATYVDSEHVLAQDWNATLKVEHCPRDIRFVALKAQHLKLMDREGENAVRFMVSRSIDNLTEQILLMHTPGMDPNNPVDDFGQLNVRVADYEWKPFVGSESVYINIRKDDLLLLTR